MERKISLLQEFVAVSRYARWLDDEGRRENWGDTVLRYVNFMNRHTEGQFESILYRQILPAIGDHAVMPSMRALMTAGPALEREGLAAFNCFHGDTKYMTINGLRTFAETVGTVQKVLSGDGIWRDAVVRCYGRQPLNKVTLRPGAHSRTSVRLEFLVTPDHRWITQAGVVTDLKLGDTVPFNAVVPPEFNAEDFIRGFGFGDGTIDNRGRARIRLCGDKAKYLGVFQSYGHLSEMYPPSYDHDPCLVFHAGHFSDWKELPEVPTYWWLAGYIAADGASGGVTPNICTQSPEAYDYLLQNLPYGGYAVVGHTEYSGPTNYGPRSNPLQKIGIRDEIDFKVMAIENTFACEEVYCVEEPITQSFTLEGGVLTGNCAYIAINHKRKFAEALYILMCGTGVGFSCERQEIQHLPTVPVNLQPCDDIITVGDSKDGWAKAYRKLVSCLYDGDIPNLDYSNVRPAGARLKIFGGRACLTGDTLVSKDRKKARGYNEITIRELYDMQNSEGFWQGKPNHFSRVRLRSLDEATGTFYRNRLLEVVDNGLAPVYEIVTENGYRIRATGNHRFLREDGEYQEVSEFSEGDMIAVNGQRQRAEPRCRECMVPISPSAVQCKACYDKSQTLDTANGTTARQRKACVDSRGVECTTCGGDGSQHHLQVHHKDRNPHNNESDNLLTLCESCHRQLHVREDTLGDAYSHRYLSFDRIVSIRYAGVEQVYDLCMEAPNHNFIANGFVSHNSGPKVFRRLCEYTVALFKKAKGRKLNSLEVHDLMCAIGEIVVVGGVRRTALISLSNLSDLRMREAKTGQWYTENPQRALANNSAAYTEMPNVEIFMEEWLSLIRSKSGERGIFNREAAQKQAAKHGRRPADYPYGVNPCAEILLRDRGLCNLTEVVIRPDDTLESLTHKVSLATILGTLQSTITNFGFVDEEWKKNAEMERLLGVSLTGIYDHPIMSGKKGKDTLVRWLKELHEVAWKINQEWSEIMGIAPSAAITCVKPSGCQKESTLLITSEGVLTLGEIGDVLGPRWQDHSLSVRSSFGMPDSTKFYVNGKAPTVVLTMASGLTLESTRNHRYQMFTGDRLVWVEADEIEVGTCLPYLVDTHSGGSRQSFVFVQGVGNAQTITQPTFLTADLAWLLGLYYGDGSTHRKGLRISGSFRKEEALRKAARIFKDVFDIDCILYPRTNGDNSLDLYANSTELVHWFTANGVRKEASHELTIPECVRRSPADVLSSFIDGFWHADGCTGGSNSRTFCTVSRTFAEQLVVCLRATGTDASMREMPPTASSWGERMRYWVSTKKGRAGAVEKSPNRVSFRELDAAGLTTLTPDFVVSIGYGECETFDIEVPEGNEYLANTYISHNTVSQLVDSASGIHPRHSAYYLRTVRLDKKDPMCAFMSAAGVYSEDALGREDTTTVFYFPVKSPEGAVLRDDINALEHLALWSIYHEHWCDHNPSITITVRDHEWFSVGAWVYENFDKVCGISFLPHSDHVYQQAPYIEVTKEQYDNWVAQHPVPEVDWALLSEYEKEDNTVSSQTLACHGNVCEIL